MHAVYQDIIKTVKGLQLKRNRDDLGLFVAEGTKCVLDTWSHFSCKYLIATQRWFDQFSTAQMYDVAYLAKARDLERMSAFSTAPEVVAVYQKPVLPKLPVSLNEGVHLVLDTIQDPGNLGTIIRLADWFGIRHIFASLATVDVYNHKVVQATMGAIAKVHIHYCDLQSLFADHPKIPRIGTTMHGKNLYSAELPHNGFIVLGNEGSGITKPILELMDDCVTIPRDLNAGSESLNVSTAAAIIISELMKNKLR